MELIDQHTKGIMEGCKEKAREMGLSFDDGSLEYIVTNRDLLELTPKLMIPTLYDYWVHDVEVLKEPAHTPAALRDLELAWGTMDKKNWTMAARGKSFSRRLRAIPSHLPPASGRGWRRISHS